MSEEQLTEFKGIVSQWEQTGMATGVARRFVIAVKEIERLREENRQLREEGAACIDCGDTIRRCKWCAEREEEWAQ